jgi:hypothetical protein
MIQFIRKPDRKTIQKLDKLTTPKARNNNTTRENTTAPTAGHIFNNSEGNMPERQY